MTSAKCFLGCINVRCGARIISILDFWICVILLIKCLISLNPFYDDFYYYNSRTEQVINDFITFSYLFLITVFLNVNYYLKESTYDHKVHKICQWLAINTIFLVFHILAITYITIKTCYPIILYYSIPICIIHFCQIYVVKSFYDDELLTISRSLPTASLESSAVARQNNVAVVNQNAPNGSVNVTLSTSPPSNPIYQAQNVPPPQEQQEAGWPRSNGAVLPVQVAPIYPQLYHGHNGTEPHFQNPMAMQAGPSSSVETQYPQEYYNPPAYLPHYNQHSGIHSVRKM